MIETTSWQSPAADDISTEALEYLFTPRYRPEEEPPWVKVSIEPEELPKEIDVPRMQAKMEVLTQRVRDLTVQMQTTAYHVGFLKGKLVEKEEQLKQLPELRLKAAKSVAMAVELESLRESYEQLEGQLAGLYGSVWGKLYLLCTHLPKATTPSEPYRPIVPWLLLGLFVLSVAIIVASCLLRQ